MTKTLRFGYDSASPRIASRIDRHVIRRHTSCGYDRLQELAQLDYARHVAYAVSPGQQRSPSKPQVTYAASAPGFGKRDAAASFGKRTPKA